MSSMSRSIRRSIAKKNGTFVAQKPLRQNTQPKSFLTMMLEKLRLKKLFAKETV